MRAFLLQERITLGAGRHLDPDGPRWAAAEGVFPAEQVAVDAALAW